MTNRGPFALCVVCHNSDTVQYDVYVPYASKCHQCDTLQHLKAVDLVRLSIFTSAVKMVEISAKKILEDNDES